MAEETRVKLTTRDGKRSDGEHFLKFGTSVLSGSLSTVSATIVGRLMAAAVRERRGRSAALDLEEACCLASILVRAAC